jgi:hypothetical protein
MCVTCYTTWLAFTTHLQAQRFDRHGVVQGVRWLFLSILVGSVSCEQSAVDGHTPILQHPRACCAAALTADDSLAV